jgi:polynucleotide 5'-triphosphatase
VYVHRRENDKFYELPPTMHGILPAAVRQQHNPRHAIKIRVTHDQKTKQVLAKIIKVRIADLNIFMPRQPLDCRISINFEMRYDGDVEEIIAQSIPDRHADRSKDRLSYTQGHYQIDLTQVSKTKSHNVNHSVSTFRDVANVI